MRIPTIADSIARWSLVVLSALIPFFVIPFAWAGIAEAKLLLAAACLFVALAAWTIARLAEGRVELPRNSILFAAALLPLAYLISALASRAGAGSYVAGDGAQDAVASVAILFSALALSSLAPGCAGRQRAAFAALLSFSLLAGSALVVVFQLLRLALPSWLSLGGLMAGSASSIAGSWHDLAVLCALVAFLASALWASPAFSRGPLRAAALALGALAFALLFFAGASDAWWTLAAVSLLFALAHWGSARFYERRAAGDALWSAAVPLAVGLLSLLLALSGSLALARLPSSLRIPQNDAHPSWSGTFAVEQSVFKGSALIFGTGPNTFTRDWSQFKPLSVNETDFWSADFESGVGVIPTALITTGILGALSWLLLLLALAWRGFRFCTRKRLTPARALPAALLGGSILLAAFHIFYTPGIALSLIFFLLLGAFIAAEDDDAPPLRIRLSFDSPFGIARVAVLLALALALAWAGVWAARAAVSDLLVAKSSAEYQSGGTLAGSLSLIRAALAAYPDNDAAHRAAVQLGLLQLQELMGSGGAPDAQALQTALSQTISEGLQAVSINSGDYQNWLALASLYQSLASAGVSGAYDNALSAYQKAAAEGPTNPLPLIGLAQVAAANNDATSSITYLTQAIRIKPDLAAAYYLRSQEEGAQGQLSAALADAQKTVSLAGEDPLGWYNLGVAYYSSADYADAVSALSQAASLQRNYANALFVLALSYDKLGERAQALSAMQQVVALNPDNATALSALKNLQAGKPALGPAKK